MNLTIGGAAHMASLVAPTGDALLTSDIGLNSVQHGVENLNKCDGCVSTFPSLNFLDKVEGRGLHDAGQINPAQLAGPGSDIGAITGSTAAIPERRKLEFDRQPVIDAVDVYG
jgi:hypothetical protein